MVACTSPENASPENRSTFIKLYTYSNNDVGYYAEPTTDGGYIILGNAEVDSLSTMNLIKTDPLGNVEWRATIDSVRGRSLKALPGNLGYLIIGERIYKTNTRIKTKMLLAKVAPNTSFDTTTFTLPSRVNTYGVTLTLQGDSVLALANAGNTAALNDCVLAKFNIASLQLGWFRTYSLNDRGMGISKRMHLNNLNHVVFSASNIRPVQEIADSYISIPSLKQNSEPLSNDRYPLVDVAGSFFFTADIHRTPSGFALIGTQTNSNNDNGRMLFLRANEDGLINQTSVRTYPKGSNDSGNSIQAITDGFILLGTLTSTPTLGNGGKDFYLVKTDFSGNVLWEKILGGSGNETGNFISVTPDGGYLILGTSEINGSKNICLVKTDRNGEL